MLWTVLEPLVHESDGDVAEELSVGDEAVVALRGGGRKIDARTAAMRYVVDSRKVAGEPCRRRLAAKKHHGYLRIAEKREEFARQTPVASALEEHACDTRLDAHLRKCAYLIRAATRRCAP